jgi:hypothetical protein
VLIGKSDDVVPILLGESAELAHRQIERREQTHIEHSCIDAVELQR